MDSSVVEFIPRPYQIELFEMALQENVIVCLKTGSGKTFIAILLLKELSADIRRPYNEGGKRTIFIVNTVPLTIQHCAYVARLTGLSCIALSGDLGVDMWSDTEWNMLLREYQVLVMTSQILVDALTHSYIQLNRVNLIIFDECHSAVNDHPMRQIMMHFECCSKEEQPKILGLSATILNSNVKLEKIESVIQSLEHTFHAKVVTAATELEHITATERIVMFDNYIIPDVAKQVISIAKNVNEILMLLKIEALSINESSIEFQSKSAIKKLQNSMQNIEYQISDTGIYGANIASLLFLIELQCKKKRAIDEEFVSVLEYVTTEIIKCRKLFENQMKNSTEVEKICSYTSHKVLKLCMILKEQYNNKSADRTFCCIIFVQRRYSAYVLFHILQNLSKYNEEYNFLKLDYMVGKEGSSLCYKEWFVLSKKNKDVVHQFRSGAINCIIATNIIEEGVDIPMCSLIISYDFPQDVRSYIQGKGRARHATSEYILLLCKSDMNSMNAYSHYKVTEQYLRQYMKNKINKQCVPTQVEINDKLYKHEIEPYIVINKNGQKVTLMEHSVVSLINMYCTSLYKSIFATLTPTWLLYKITGTNLEGPDSSGEMFKVSLKLPVVSPLKTVIFGDPMKTINKAKRSAAMKTCIELHKINELSDVLMPYTSEKLQQQYNYLFPNWIEDDESDKTKIIGTKKKKRHYKLEFPSPLYAAFPLPQQKLYLHILHIKPKYFTSHDDNRRLTFYNLLTNRAGFCILSTKRMPEIPSFPLLMSFGELNVDVKANHSTTYLLAEQITYIKTFHTLIFSEIVPVIKPFMVFDNYNRDNCFLVAPVDENFDLNWDVMKQYNCITRLPPPDPFVCKAKDYELSLVIPTYRASAEVYIVTQVCKNIAPISCFPTDNFISYCHYYKEKHGLVITNLIQPMLEVKAVSNKINYIIPRHMQVDFTKRKQAEIQEHLVPELCTRIDFPALYWLKATVLPSILHRVSQLLIAEDLRQIIVMEAKLGTLSDNSKWPPLVITDEETEESFELASESSVMENVDTLLPELPLNGLEIDVLNKEDCRHPSPKYEDLLHLYRNIDEIQLIQIEHYCQHMLETNDDNKNKKEHKKGNFKNKPFVPVPPLEMLLVENLSGPSPVQIMYALTTAAGQDAFNLERLEILGDSYLKFITTLFLYQIFPNRNEGVLTTLKGKIIGNRNLCYCGSARNIPGRMKVDGFVPLSNFIAPAYTVFRPLQTILLDAQVSPNVLYEIEIPQNEQLHGRISESTKNMMHQKVLNWVTAESQTGMEQYLGIQSVSDKSVADCVEALIGVYVTSMGIKNAAGLLKWLQILPNDTDINSLLRTIPSKPTISDVDINRIMPWASDIETKIGYKFKNRQYLLQAFTHPSYTANNVTECYERLEFLGDALLDFLVTSYIYTYCRNLSPGTLTDLRSALVNNVTLACLAVRYGLHTALLFYAPELNNHLNRFVKFQEERNHSVNDELLWILLQEEECNISEFVDVPKALGDIYESLIGAIYLDSNKNLMIVWEMVYSFMHNEFEQFSKNIPKQAIRVLYEIQGAHPQFLNPVVIEETNSVMVPLKVTVAGTIKLFNGFGANKKQAKCAAAKQALKSLLSKT